VAPRSLDYVPQKARHSGRDDTPKLRQRIKNEKGIHRGHREAEPKDKAHSPCLGHPGSGLEEGVGVALAADGGGGTVAGVDDGVVGELEEFGLQGIHDLIERATPEIGAADAASEECVSREELRLGELDFTGILGEIQADAAGRVARSVNNIGLEAAPTESVAFLEKMIDLHEFGCFHAQEGGLDFHAVIKGEIIVVHHNGRAGVLMELGEAADVINVGVGADDDLDDELVAAQKTEDAFDFIAGIDDDGFAGFGIADDQTVALKHADGELDVDHLRIGGVGKTQSIERGVHLWKYSIEDVRRGCGLMDEGCQ